MNEDRSKLLDMNFVLQAQDALDEDELLPESHEIMCQESCRSSHCTRLEYGARVKCLAGMPIDHNVCIRCTKPCHFGMSCPHGLTIAEECEECHF